MWSRERKGKVSSGRVGEGQRAGEESAKGLRRALLAGGERFPEEVFTGGFAIPLGKR